MAIRGMMVLPLTTIRAGNMKRIDLLLMDFGMRTSDGDMQLFFEGDKRTSPCSPYPDQSYRTGEGKSINSPEGMGEHAQGRVEKFKGGGGAALRPRPAGVPFLGPGQ